MKQQYILNLTNIWLYFMGRGNMATAAFIRDWSSFFFFLSFFRWRCWFSPLWTLGFCFRDVSFFKGPHTPQRRNKHYLCFSFLPPYHLVCPRVCVTLDSVPSFDFHSLRRWSHMSKPRMWAASAVPAGGRSWKTVSTFFCQQCEISLFFPAVILTFTCLYLSQNATVSYLSLLNI